MSSTRYIASSLHESLPDDSSWYERAQEILVARREEVFVTKPKNKPVTTPTATPALNESASRPIIHFKFEPGYTEDLFQMDDLDITPSGKENTGPQEHSDDSSSTELVSVAPINPKFMKRQTMESNVLHSAYGSERSSPVPIPTPTPSPARGFNN